MIRYPIRASRATETELEFGRYVDATHVRPGDATYTVREAEPGEAEAIARGRPLQAAAHLITTRRHPCGVVVRIVIPLPSAWRSDELAHEYWQRDPDRHRRWYHRALAHPDALLDVYRHADVLEGRATPRHPLVIDALELGGGA